LKLRSVGDLAGEEQDHDRADQRAHQPGDQRDVRDPRQHRLRVIAARRRHHDRDLADQLAVDHRRCPARHVAGAADQVGGRVGEHRIGRGRAAVVCDHLTVEIERDDRLDVGRSGVGDERLGHQRGVVPGEPEIGALGQLLRAVERAPLEIRLDLRPDARRHRVDQREHDPGERRDAGDQGDQDERPQPRDREPGAPRGVAIERFIQHESATRAGDRRSP
jgi:hypothetical protein